MASKLYLPTMTDLILPLMFKHHTFQVLLINQENFFKTAAGPIGTLFHPHISIEVNFKNKEKQEFIYRKEPKVTDRKPR